MPAMKELKDYEVVSVIGSGSFGTCFKVRDRETSEVFAWKAVDYNDLSDSKKEALIQEINVLRQLSHPNIVQYHDYILNKEAKTIYIVMECCEGGDLDHLIDKCRAEKRRFEEPYIWRVLYQVCRALHTCHTKLTGNTILHRDIKPANIFLDINGNAKLGDFGLARVLKRNQTFAESFVGTPCYMSPEIVKGSKYDRKSDVWAVGCLIYEMCALRPPFQGRRLDLLSRKISSGKFQDIPEMYSQDLHDIISFMLEVNSARRPNIEVILRHPILIRNYNFEEDDPTYPELVFLDRSPPKLGQGKSLKFSPSPKYSSTIIDSLDISTPLLRSELFGTSSGTAKRQILSATSDPDLYETIRYENNSVLKPKEVISPAGMTQNIFDDVLESRLHAIRAQEALLKQKEESLLAKEKELNDREKRLCHAEKVFEDKKKSFEKRFPDNFKKANVIKCKPLDDTYCTVEPNDSMFVPTVAKMDLAVIVPPKSLSNRHVTFKSPKKFTKYNIENTSPPSQTSKSTAGLKMSVSASSVSSKTSDSSDQSQKRKSILSIFGINPSKSKDKKENTTQQNGKHHQTESKPQDKELTQKWTIENKKAAFEMLAAMNAADRRAQDENEYNFKTQQRHRTHRQSVRKSQTFQRTHNRKSMMALQIPSDIKNKCIV